jgi:GTPase
MGIFGKVFGGGSGFDKNALGGGNTYEERRVNDIINRGPVRPDGILLVQGIGKKGPYTIISGEVYSGNLYQGQKAELAGREIIIRSILVNYKPVLDAQSGEAVVLKVNGVEPEHVKPGTKLNFNASKSQHF